MISDSTNVAHIFSQSALKSYASELSAAADRAINPAHESVLRQTADLLTQTSAALTGLNKLPIAAGNFDNAATLKIISLSRDQMKGTVSGTGVSRRIEALLDGMAARALAVKEPLERERQNALMAMRYARGLVDGTVAGTEAWHKALDRLDNAKEALSPAKRFLAPKLADHVDKMLQISRVFQQIKPAFIAAIDALPVAAEVTVEAMPPAIIKFNKPAERRVKKAGHGARDRIDTGNIGRRDLCLPGSPGMKP